MNEIEQIILPIKKEIDVFECKLKKIVEKENNFLSDDLKKFIFTNPKRLRPILVLLFAKILNIHNKSVYNIALALELIHSASLIHDDIIDMEDYRRGIDTFYNKYGSKLAVLEGDLLLAMALEILSEGSLEILKIFSSKIKKTINGEIIQNAYIDKVLDVEQYMNKTYNKTSTLFMAGLESLFTLGEFSNEIKQGLSRFLVNFTIAFQIKNDVDNFISNKTDIKNGNYTLPVIYFCMENQFDKPDMTKDFSKYINMANEVIDDYAAKAIFDVENIDKTEYGKTLTGLCKFILRRD